MPIPTDLIERHTCQISTLSSKITILVGVMNFLCPEFPLVGVLSFLLPEFPSAILVGVLNFCRLRPDIPGTSEKTDNGGGRVSWQQR